MNKHHQPPTMYNVQEIAEALDLSPSQITKECQRGKFPGAFKAGRHNNSPWRIPEEGVVKYLKSLGYPLDLLPKK